MSVKALLDELDIMVKAQPAAGSADDDKKIAAAAADGDGKVEGADADPDKDGDGDGDNDGDGDGKGMAKSFKITLADGSEAEAVDGAPMIKSLGDKLDLTEATMLKALGQTMAIIKGQDAMIK